MPDVTGAESALDAYVFVAGEALVKERDGRRRDCRRGWAAHGTRDAITARHRKIAGKIEC